MEVIILPDSDSVARRAADTLAAMVSRKPAAVLGLATGSTPLALYRELVLRHRRDALSFRAVTSFNLDEYLGLAEDSPLSYRRYMQQQLFDHIDIKPDNTHLPSCDSGQDPRAVGPLYEAAIRRAGGIDLQVLGIGANGHIGFNEPGSSLGSQTRVKTLARHTLEDNSRGLGAGDALPAMAITMGIETILSSRRVLLLATGEHKAPAVAQALEGAITCMHPASILQTHPRVRVLLDEAAAGQLSQLAYHHWVARQSAALEALHGGSADEDPWFHPSVEER